MVWILPRQNVLHGQKWQARFEAHVDIKTTGGYLLRLFCVGFTKHNTQIQKTSYAQHQQVCQLWKNITEITTQEVRTNDLKAVVSKLTPDSTGKDPEKAPIYVSSS